MAYKTPLVRLQVCNVLIHSGPQSKKKKAKKLTQQSVRYNGSPGRVRFPGHPRLPQMERSGLAVHAYGRYLSALRRGVRSRRLAFARQGLPLAAVHAGPGVPH
ncbi:hypothetical protein COCON_G00070880 [Conger conger]|uniref:Uncharacterized protein n=1 Tax=Conger conger TaxID=82655 RepID=A0A9Q1I2Q4_CONCO|nr:hypothetical protein COCON_G00070880 [Conger conger]